MPIKPAVDAQGNIIPGTNCTSTTPAGGPSIEYYLANQLKDQVLNLRVGGPPDQHSRSFRMDLTADWGDADPQNAFKNLFKDFAGNGGPLTPEDRLRGKRKSVLDAVQANFNRVLMRAGRGGPTPPPAPRRPHSRVRDRTRSDDQDRVRQAHFQPSPVPSTNKIIHSRVRTAFRTT